MVDGTGPLDVAAVERMSPSPSSIPFRMLRFWRSPADQPRWARPTLLIVTALAGLAYAWRFDQAYLEPFYGGAARSMSLSLHNFFYGAADPWATARSTTSPPRCGPGHLPAGLRVPCLGARPAPGDRGDADRPCAVPLCGRWPARGPALSPAVLAGSPVVISRPRQHLGLAAHPVARAWQAMPPSAPAKPAVYARPGPATGRPRLPGQNESGLARGPRSLLWPTSSPPRRPLSCGESGTWRRPPWWWGSCR